ncbi:MAG: 23S rRNA (pseudouridine(1915)-N(3))-methyltransferase RlmH [Vicingaceae bacterium]
MLIRILIIGETQSREIDKLLDDYMGRLKHYARVELKYLKYKSKKKNNPDYQTEKEGELILNEVQAGSHFVLLDEKGKSHSSMSFAKFMQKQLMSGKQELVFGIGGAYGFSKAVYQRADAKLALSQMTFTHQMVRLIFVEQLYRAFTILKGEKYHH